MKNTLIFGVMLTLGKDLILSSGILTKVRNRNFKEKYNWKEARISPSVIVGSLAKIGYQEGVEGISEVTLLTGTLNLPKKSSASNLS